MSVQRSFALNQLLAASCSTLGSLRGIILERLLSPFVLANTTRQELACSKVYLQQKSYQYNFCPNDGFQGLDLTDNDKAVQ
jgi:hypothetical protein